MFGRNFGDKCLFKEQLLRDMHKYSLAFCTASEKFNIEQKGVFKSPDKINKASRAARLIYFLLRFIRRNCRRWHNRYAPPAVCYKQIR